MHVVCYLRVSTDAQDVSNQKRGVSEYCASKRWTPIFLEDSASGKTPWRLRKIGQLITGASAGDVVVVSEVSRLARSTLQVLEIAQACVEKNIELHAVKNGMVFDGSMQSKITATVLGLAAEIERDLISSRTKEALAKRKAAGQILGRPAGQPTSLKLDSRAGEIDKLLAAGVSKRVAAKALDVSHQTLYDWLKKRRPV